MYKLSYLYFIYYRHTYMSILLKYIFAYVLRKKNFFLTYKLFQ